MAARIEMLWQVREKIETAGREPRWEFSKTALFERSAHIADVCTRLLAALETYHGLRQTLGAKLEAMTGNSQVSPGPFCNLLLEQTRTRLAVELDVSYMLHCIVIWLRLS